MVTTVPPSVLPEVGLTEVTAGAGVTKVKWSPALVAEVPAGRGHRGVDGARPTRPGWWP